MIRKNKKGTKVEKMKTIKICGWITFTEKIVCLLLVGLIFFTAYSCMSYAEGCASNSLESMNNVDRESVTAGYEVLGNLGSTIAGGMTWTVAALVIGLTSIPLLLYVLTCLVNIIGMVKLKQSKTGAINASSIITIIVDILLLLLYLAVLIPDINPFSLLVSAVVCVVQIFDITVNSILLYNVCKIKKSVYIS